MIGLYVLVSMLSISQDILLPIIYATLIAILLSPLVNFLTSKKVGRALSIFMVLTLVLLIIAAIVLLVSSQANKLREAWPHLSQKFKDFFQLAISWTSENFHVSTQKIEEEISHAKNDLFSTSSQAIGATLSTMGGVFSTIFLTPVYVFMILFYQSHLLEFIHKLFGSRNGDQVSEVLSETKSIIQSYLVGLFAEIVIVAILNSIGLMILGIDYAILLGMLGAVLNVIPYLGGIIAMAIFMAIALVTKSPVYVFYVGALYTVIQLIDNNYIVPKIVGSKVKLNALISLLVVIAGAALWGIPGMFLSIPITAILKVICDHVEQLKPFGFLLGNTITASSKEKIIRITNLK